MSLVTVDENTITENHQVKTPISDKEKLELLDQIVKVDLEINEKSEALKNYTKAAKDEIGDLAAKISQWCGRVRTGVVSETYECAVTYEGTHITFTNVKNGEIVEQREMTEEEQLRLTSNRVDAEVVIRQARRKADKEDKE